MRLTGLCGAGVVVFAVTVAASQAPSGARYTKAQADAGRVAFDRKCASCHMPDASGDRRAPALTGSRFLNRWGDRRVRDLFVRMRAGMPPIGVRPTGDAFTAIIAFLLQANGLPAGTEALDATSYDTLTRSP